MYIVKNCPAKPSSINACYGWCDKEQTDCQDCTDCITKQVIKRLKSYLIPYDCDCETREDATRNNLSVEILSMFEIEEVE